VLTAEQWPSSPPWPLLLKRGCTGALGKNR
jgi:hypothetical protein